jgi:hypothetical protein
MAISKSFNSRMFSAIIIMIILSLNHIPLLGQVDREEVIVDNALKYFCDVVLPEGFPNGIIKYKGKTEGEFSRIYNIADCIGEISLLTFFAKSLSDTTYYDSIQKPYSLLPKKELIAKSDCKRIKRFWFPRRGIYILHIFRPIKYNNKIYIVFFVNSKHQWRNIITIEADKDCNIISHYIKSYIS